MTRIRYLTLLTALLCGTAGAQDFNPDSPAEPGEPPQPLVLLVTPAGSGSVAGAGRYVPGSEVRVSASAATGFRFEAWTDTRGTVLSTQAAFTFEKKRKADTLVARYFYAPEGPSEPSDPTLVQYFTLTLAPATGGTASGGGRYRAGSHVSLSASPSTGFVFEGWFDAGGSCLSAERTFTYVTAAANMTLTPRFRFDPQAPSEPSEPVLSHNILLEATDGGTASAGNMRLREGSSTTVTARANEGYEFVRWLMNGEPYTELPNFSYTMGRDDVTFRAEFRFNPAAPDEPSMPATKQYAFYLMSVIGVPGETSLYPVYLTTLDDLCDMTFQLTFPPGLTPALESVRLSAKAEGYELSCTAVSDTSYVFTLTGGRLPAGNTQLLVFDVPVPEDMETAQSYPVKINQVSVTEPDGDHLTASTRNGRLYVYRRGDTNGDGRVNLTDKMNLVTYVLGTTPDSFIREVSDVNRDGTFDLRDCRGVADIINEQEE